MLTAPGTAAYETHLAQQAAASDQIYKRTEGAVNLDDPALKPKGFDVLDFSAPLSPDAVKGLIVLNGQQTTKIKNLEKSLDDMGTLADRMTKRIKELETSARPTSPDNVDALLATNRAESFENILSLADEDGFNGAALDYVIWLREMIRDRTAELERPDRRARQRDRHCG